MRAQTKDFAKCKRKVPLEARDDAKRRNAHLDITLAGDKLEVVGGMISWVWDCWLAECTHGI